MSLSWPTILAIGVGGFLGAVARAYVASSMNTALKSDFPWGILTVNVVGSFLIGILFAIFMHYSVPDSVKGFLTTGFLGALTTYSTFAIESYILLETSLFLAFSNMALNLFGTILAAGSGYRVINYFLR